MNEIFPSKKDGWSAVLFWGIVVCMLGLVALGVIDGASVSHGVSVGDCIG